ncbi:MAG: SCP2 sterol-binding domain-containing protein [Lentisphaeria bacterium]|nr:SCP2 sterol-binding domain-containing protein [Lentisphaeria bacterium]
MTIQPGGDTLSFAADFFDRHLPSLIDQPLLAGYEGYDMACEIHFQDVGKRWRVDIENGRIRGVRALTADDPSPRVLFVVDEAVFRDIISGRLSPQKAFFTRRTNIKGDFFQGMKLAKLLGLFFDRFPYREEEREGVKA